MKDSVESGKIAFELLQEKLKSQRLLLSNVDLAYEVDSYHSTLNGSNSKERMRAFLCILHGKVIQKSFPKIEVINVAALSQEEIYSIAYDYFLEIASKEGIMIENVSKKMEEMDYSKKIIDIFIEDVIRDLYHKMCLVK